MRYLILLLLITSCASRKVDVSKIETKISIDSTLIVKKDSISEINTNLPHIVEKSLANCVWAFHDMNPKFINHITNNANCKLLYLVGTLGVFQFLGSEKSV